MAYLKYLHNTGLLAKLSYNPTDVPPTDLGQKGDFFFSVKQGRFCASGKFKRAWLHLRSHFRLSDSALLSAIEIFILHELFHYEQRLTGEQHSDIRSAQAVLRVIDYHADANAVLSLLFLSAEFGEIDLEGTMDHIWELLRPATDNRTWPLYIAAAKSQLRHIYAFHLMEETDTWAPSTFLRHFTWHYQFHRISEFRRNAHFQEVQLLFEPGISIRSLQQADWDSPMPPVTRQWPDTEEAAIRGPSDLDKSPKYILKPNRETKDREKVWLAAPNYWGVATVFRFSPNLPKSYNALFDGIFDGNVEITKTFFLNLFDRYPELTGVWSSVPTGEPPPPTNPTEVEKRVTPPDDAPQLLKWAAADAQDQGTRYLPVKALAYRLDTPPPAEGAVGSGG